jgi:hypothetical protein
MKDVMTLVAPDPFTAPNGSAFGQRDIRHGCRRPIVESLRLDISEGVLGK